MLRSGKRRSRACRSLVALVCVLGFVLTTPRVGTSGAQDQEDQLVRLELVQEFFLPHADASKLAVSPDDRLLVVMGSYALHIWDIRSNRLIATLSVAYPENRLRDFVIDETGEILAYLVSGADPQVVFLDLDTGAKINVLTGAPARSSGQAGDGTWVWPRRSSDYPESVEVVGSPGTRLNSVAVAFSSGNIRLLDLGASEERTVSTGMVNLREVRFASDNTLSWVGSHGLGWQTAAGRNRSIEFPNYGAYYSHNKWVLSAIELENYQPWLREYEYVEDAMAYEMASDLYVAEGDLLDSDVEFITAGPADSRGYLLAYTSGRLQLIDDEGNPTNALEPRSHATEASEIAPTAITTSPSRRIVVLGRGPFVSVYEVD